MRILGAMVARNEQDRYLSQVLEWHLEFLDGIHLFDDRSDDGTAVVAADAGAVVDVRPHDVSRFLEHEGDFRQAAWESFELDMQPVPGEDWVLSIDADEFFVSQTAGPERLSLERLVSFARSQEANAINLRIDEIFGVDVDGTPLKRVDGFWGQIAAPRFFRYQAGGHFANRRMGCGSTPTYVRPVSAVKMAHSILHYGYADEIDRHVKHRRYTHIGQGHSSKHVDSILQPPTLERLEGERWPT